MILAQLPPWSGVVAQVSEYIDVAEVVGQGGGFSSAFALFASAVGLAVVASGAYGGIRWFSAASSKTAAASTQVLPREVRLEVQRAMDAGYFEQAGEMLAAAGEPEEAAEAFVKGGAFVKAARTFHAVGSHAQAIYCFKKAGDYQQAARLYVADGRHRDAAAEYFRIESWALAAEQYQLAGDFKRAAENYERAELFLKAAQCFEQAGLAQKAADHYVRYFERRLSESGNRVLDEDRAYARHAGELLVAAGNFERAGAIFSQGGFWVEAAESLLEVGEFERAAGLLMKANEPLRAAKVLEDAGQQQNAALMRADAALKAGDKVGAAALFRQAGEFERAAYFFEESGKISEAAELYERVGAYEQALELYSSLNMYAHAARCAEQCAQLARAAELYSEAGDVEGQLRVLTAQGDFFRAGRLQFEHRRYDDAIRSLDGIDSRDPIYPRGLELQGDAYRAQGRAEKAYSKYRAAVGNRSIETATRGLFYKMGLALEDEADLNGALECYTAVIGVDSGYEDVVLRQKTVRQRLRRSTSTNVTSSGLFSAAEIDTGDGALQRYEIVEEIARGGMGVVYKARDTVLGRVVAYKILGENLRDNETAVKYFLREARAAAALSHPNIVTIFDAGEQDGEYYMAMEFVEGTTLKELVRRSGALPEDKVRYILIHCSRALQYAHSKGIIHRDIKSGNVMTTRDMALKVMDFGLAKFLREYQNNHTQQVGTPFYMSPEQIIGKDIDFRSDLYGLGCMIFECATGTVPFFKGDLSYHHLHTPPPSPRMLNPSISRELERIILKLLEKDPAKRYQSADELLAVLG